MREIWKNIEGYNGKYQISNLGRVKSFTRLKNGYIRVLSKSKKGYLRVSIEGKTLVIHRLVASAFIPKIKGKNQVNHKDGNLENNCVDNLEWVDNRENNIHAYRYLNRKAPFLGRTGKKSPCSKPVLQIKNGKIIKEFESTMCVQRELGFQNARISECCRGKIKNYKGFEWRYK